MRIRQKRRRTNLSCLFFALVLLVGGLGAAGVLAWIGAGRASANLGAPADDLNPAEQALLTAYLGARADDLRAPAGADPSPVPFTVEAGQPAGEVAAQLAAQGLVRDAQLLVYYLRYRGLDQHVEAGDFVLRRTMTVPEVAAALTDAQAREVLVRIPEGWRLEQIASALSADPALAVAADEFMALVGPGAPRFGAHSFNGDLPAGASLEGFLFPDTYILKPGATARDVADRALRAFDAHLTTSYRSAVAARGLSVYQAVTIASLIEREAVLDDERPLIASVILNRLAVGQQLEIDATVQYAVATPDDWWPRVAGLDFRSIASPYNTYYVGGLPAGPIASVRLTSLLAVAAAPETGYFYYRATCQRDGRHNFAATYQEHLANACP